MFKIQIDSREDTFSSETEQQEPLVQFSSINTGTMQLNPVMKRRNVTQNKKTQTNFKLLTFPSMNVLLCRNKRDLCFLWLYSFCAKTWKQKRHPVSTHDFHLKTKFTNHQYASRQKDFVFKCSSHCFVSSTQKN